MWNEALGNENTPWDATNTLDIRFGCLQLFYRVVDRPAARRGRGSHFGNEAATRSSLRVRLRSTFSPCAYLHSMRTTIVLDTFDGISPYLGGGLGRAFAVVSGLHFSSEYEDTSGDAPAYNPPRSFYNSRQDADLSDTVLAGHLHNGVDYSLNDKTLVGLKLTYSMMGNIDASGRYSLHPFNERDPALPNHNAFSGARSWTLMLTVKRRFGN